MSNDLISKNALLKELEEKVYPEKYGEKCNALDVINGVLQVIGEQPTAYDVDKVVEQMKEINEEDDICEKFKDKDRRHCKNAKGCFDRAICEAIEIVKSGGILKG